MGRFQKYLCLADRCLTYIRSHGLYGFETPFKNIQRGDFCRHPEYFYGYTPEIRDEMQQKELEARRFEATSFKTPSKSSSTQPESLEAHPTPQPISEEEFLDIVSQDN